MCIFNFLIAISNCFLPMKVILNSSNKKWFLSTFRINDVWTWIFHGSNLILNLVQISFLMFLISCWGHVLDYFLTFKSFLAGPIWSIFILGPHLRELIVRMDLWNLFYLHKSIIFYVIEWSIKYVSRNATRIYIKFADVKARLKKINRYLSRLKKLELIFESNQPSIYHLEWETTINKFQVYSLRKTVVIF